jgi:DNA polymerase-3 subunit epsilon
MPAAHPEEAETLLRWLEQPGVRLVDVAGAWASPLHGAVGARHRLEAGQAPDPGGARRPASRRGTP